MADTLTIVVYVAVALAGMVYYQYQGWKASGEPFDASKFVDTALSSGNFAIIGSAVGLAQVGLGFTPESLGALAAAFGLTAGIDTLWNKSLKNLKEISSYFLVKYSTLIGSLFIHLKNLG